MRRWTAALTAALTIGGGAAHAQSCVAPGELPVRPILVRPTEPATPSCMNKAQGTHRCNNKIIDAYNVKIDAYNAAQQTMIDTANRYTRKLRDYLDTASDYAECENSAVRTAIRNAPPPTTPGS